MSPPPSPTTPTSRATWTRSRSRSRRTGRGAPSTPHGTACRMTRPWGLRECQRGASSQQWPSWAHSSTIAPSSCAARSPGCSGKSPVRTAYAPRCTAPSRNWQPWRGATGSTAYPGPWPPWEWGSTTPLRAPGQPTSNYSPHRATSSCCAPPTCGTATRVA